jgi:type IV pilus assembly protein PilQ
VTTDKKVLYELDQKEPKTLVLKIQDTTIPPLIMRQMESQYFTGVVERVKATLDPGTSGVSVAIMLREKVPFHVKQTDKAISIDFDRTAVKAPEKKIVPLRLSQTAAADQEPVKPTRLPAQAMRDAVTPGDKAVAPLVAGTPVSSPFPQEIPGAPKRYTGAPMTMDFLNADVTNILRLIGEVSNLNIVWGPDVKGMVSMRLKDVPWDQALDLILENNNLAKRHAGNVIWVTTKAQLSQIEAEERRRIEQYEAKLEAERKKVIQDREKEKELEPLVTEYLPVDFATANEIMSLLALTEQGKSRGGKISVDARTNTIIVTDIASSVQKAKGIVKQFDTPVKQVMIEARIVDATDSLVKDLGIRWDNLQIQKRSSVGVPFTTFAPPASLTPGNPSAFPVPPSQDLISPGFSSIDPWSGQTGAPNLGLVFSTLSASGLTATVLDAKLALSELEGTSKTISAPKVVAMNGKAATISRGQEQTIPATENVASTPFKAELELSVTPTVSFNNYITLTVSVSDDQPIGTLTKTTKKINTVLMVKSGDTVVIGGILTENETQDENGIPGLRRIPFAGWLFKSRSDSLRKTELLIFLTPTVVPSGGKT